MAKPYHHGDLRAALIAQGLALIESGGADDVSLREIARRVAVSPAAVYRHFPDKTALMAALAQEGLAELAARQAAASVAAGGGRTGFAASGVAYVRFALDKPGLFRLTFTHAAPPGRFEAADAATMLLAASAALAPPGEDPKVFALRAWAGVHGLAMLMLDGLLDLDDAGIAAVVTGDAGAVPAA